MAWDDGLLDEQRRAACHMGSHACLRAGPGTGKTLTLCRRIVYLCAEENVSPDEVLALTFTRAATHELRQRLRDELRQYELALPRVSTLHAFALRQLLRNSRTVTTVPAPLRIADDWEERSIILEDLKATLGIDIRETRTKFHRLSADWETLDADIEGWEAHHPEPEFLGAWREHSKIYGYTLRAQLVYELKRALERNPDFSLEQSFKHVLVDEYQDLNRCDLAVVKALTDQGAELFSSGDDDQSIYGFRFAHPEGIRSFGADYVPSTLLDLEYCKRCDKAILRTGLFVANLDPRRIKKPLKSMPDAGAGDIRLLRFDHEDEEADGIATICKHFIETRGYSPGGVLILLRSDYKGVFSDVIRQNMEAHGIPVVCKTDSEIALDWDEGRALLSILRLSVADGDHLAWRTVLDLRKNHIGERTISGVYDLAVREGTTFTAALRTIRDSPGLLPRLGDRLAEEISHIEDVITRFKAGIDGGGEWLVKIRELAEETIPDRERRDEVLGFVEKVAETSEARTLPELVSALNSSMENEEQELDSGRVNIMTMHRAKGLTADAVFIVGAEDEYIPDGQRGEEEGDARRLLYVSLTRAKHAPVITYCRRRVGRQKFTGTNRGRPGRTLSRFLKDAPVRPESGIDYVKGLP